VVLYAYHIVIFRLWECNMSCRCRSKSLAATWWEHDWPWWVGESATRWLQASDNSRSRDDLIKQQLA